MSKKILALIGFSQSDPSLEYKTAEVISEIETGGSDSDGFKGYETLGLAKDMYGSHFLYRGSKHSNTNDKHMPTYFSDDCDNIPELLRALANEIHKEYRHVINVSEIEKLPHNLDEHIDNIDAAIFTGDTFNNDLNRINDLQKIIKRWNKQLEINIVYIKQLEEENKYEL